MTEVRRKYLEWIGFNDYEIQEVETEIKNGEEPLVFEGNQFYAWESGYNKSNEWHKIFVNNEPYKYEYWDLPQDTLPKIENFYFVKLKNGFVKICELKYDTWSRKKYFYDLHGGKQSNVAEWLEYPKGAENGTENN